MISFRDFRKFFNALKIKSKKETEKPKIKPELRPESKLIVKKLNNNERGILRAIIQSEQMNEEPNQVYISNKTKIPKSTLTSRINRLEIWGILKREKKGRENIVKLRNWVRDILGEGEFNYIELRMIEIVLLLKEKDEIYGRHMTQSEISKRIDVPKSTVATYLKKLLGKNIIEISRDSGIKEVKLQQEVKDQINYKDCSDCSSIAI